MDLKRPSEGWKVPAILFMKLGFAPHLARREGPLRFYDIEGDVALCTMKIIKFYEIGGPEVLRYEDVERTGLAPTRVLVRIHAIGVNFADTVLRRGGYLAQPKLPETPGFEAAGVVVETGKDANRHLVGKRVVVLGERCYAEYVTALPSQLIGLPDNISFEQGAAFPVQALTAYHMLYTVDHVARGRTVLVHAAAGGVGLLAVQMAKLGGARVIGTTSSEEKARFVQDAGADEIILYNQVDFAKRVGELTQQRGVDIVLDSVGKATLQGSLSSLAPFGHLISYGSASGKADPIDVSSLYARSLKVSAFWLFTVTRTPRVAQNGVKKVLEWIESGKIRLRIGLKLPLEQAAEAHRRMEARQTTGKILLTVD
jgi:NADPH2:quinone reductase